MYAYLRKCTILAATSVQNPSWMIRDKLDSINQNHHTCSY